MGNSVSILIKSIYYYLFISGLITLGVVFAFIAKFGISGSFGVVYNLTTELYPTVVR